MSFLPEIKYIYSVRNADPIDVAAAEAVVLDSVPVTGGTFDYKVLQFSNAHQFQGTETWVQDMKPKDITLNKWNPIYYDLSSQDPYVIGAEMVEAAENNRKFISDLIIETAAGHLFKNGLSWSAADKFTFHLYWLKIQFIGSIGNVGSILAELQADKLIIDTPAVVTVTDPFTGSTHNVNQLNSGILQFAIDKCLIYKKKYPDGTI